MAEPKNQPVERTVRESFDSQQLMTTIGARLTRISPGEVEIRVPFPIGSHAAAWLPPRRHEPSMIANGEETPVATMLATIMTVRDRPDVVG